MTKNTDLSPLEADIRRYDYDRWLCCLFAPKERRDRLFSVLAFNIEIARVRETVSEPLLGDIRLQWWRDALTGLENKTSKSHPVVEALYEANRHTPINFGLMLEMVDMRAKDLDPAPINTTGELLVYADLTGGALHQLMYQALGGEETSEKIEAVTRAGRCYALTGILRAMPFHASHGLALIPKKAMSDNDVTEETIFKPENRSIFLSLVKKMADFTKQELDEARQMAGVIGRAEKASVLCNALSVIYLKRLAGAKYEPSAPEMTVGNVRKITALSLYRLLV